MEQDRPTIAELEIELGDFLYVNFREYMKVSRPFVLLTLLSMVKTGEEMEFDYEEAQYKAPVAIQYAFPDHKLVYNKRNGTSVLNPKPVTTQETVSHVKEQKEEQPTPGYMTRITPKEAVNRQKPL